MTDQPHPEQLPAPPPKPKPEPPPPGVVSRIEVEHLLARIEEIETTLEQFPPFNAAEAWHIYQISERLEDLSKGKLV